MDSFITLIEYKKGALYMDFLLTTGQRHSWKLEVVSSSCVWKSQDVYLNPEHIHEQGCVDKQLEQQDCPTRCDFVATAHCDVERSNTKKLICAH